MSAEKASYQDRAKANTDILIFAGVAGAAIGAAGLYLYYKKSIIAGQLALASTTAAAAATAGAATASKDGLSSSLD